jgi:carbonic anhydrase
MRSSQAMVCPPVMRPLCVVLCLAGLLMTGLPAHASDDHDAKPKAKAKSAEGHVTEAAPAPKVASASASAPLAAPAPAATAAASTKHAPPVPDPMDRLRERLAEKLGAVKAPDANANVLKVSARSAPVADAPAAVLARPAAKPTAAGHAKPAAAASHGTAVAMAGRAPGAPAHDPHWEYGGDYGPQAWGAMRPEFNKCSTGARQSPIDIREGIKVQLDPVQFDYRPSGFRVIDNGHTVQVNVGSGNSIEVGGRRYELIQFHFHRPSEERIDGRQFDMVAHLVHKDVEGRLAVVAVLLDRGSAQPLVQSVWNNLPLEKGDEVAAKGAIDLNALLPPERSYFTYMGSLTTPPCSEGVLWMVMKQPVPISPEQIAIFARLYPMNARPIQSASGRLIKESN